MDLQSSIPQKGRGKVPVCAVEQQEGIAPECRWLQGRSVHFACMQAGPGCHGAVQLALFLSNLHPPYCA
jgi:hypothetical protein